VHCVAAVDFRTRGQANQQHIFLGPVCGTDGEVELAHACAERDGAIDEALGRHCDGFVDASAEIQILWKTEQGVVRKLEALNERGASGVSTIAKRVPGRDAELVKAPRVEQG
jgi:hypothetical protein